MVPSARPSGGRRSGLDYIHAHENPPGNRLGIEIAAGLSYHAIIKAIGTRSGTGLERSAGGPASPQNGGKMKTIQHLMRLKGKEIWTTTPETSVFEALKIMAEKDIGAMPVMEGKKVVGIFSERDYARKVILKGKSSKDMPVREIMSTHLVLITPDQTTEQGLALMSAKHVRHLPVMQNQELVGFLSIGDLVKSIIDEQNLVIDKLGRQRGENSGMS
jgi:CBS domain-containing protein